MSDGRVSGGPVRIGLVGCGRLAEHGYLPAGRLARGVSIVAVADPDRTRRQAVADLAGDSAPVDAFPDAAALLAGADVDAVVLATPARHHVVDAERAIATGVHVLVEKPPAPDASGARTLAGLGERVHVGFNRRFGPGVAALRSDLPPKGRLDLRLSIAYRRASWRAHTVRDDVVLDLVPHLVDWARWISRSDVASVAAAELAPDRATLTVDLATGRGRATLTAAADRLHKELIEARDADGRVVARRRVGGVGGAVAGRGRAAVDQRRGRPRPHPLAASLAAQLEAVAAVVRGDDPGPLATAADGVAAMEVVDAARASAGAGGAPMSVRDPREQPTC